MRGFHVARTLPALRTLRIRERLEALRSMVEVPGLGAVYRKELADQLGSRRFVILFALIFLAGLSSAYVAALSLRDALGDTSAPQHAFLLLFTESSDSVPVPPFLTFFSFLGPLVGLALAFDSINGELSRGTLSRLLAQPIYRDSVINGKFLAALTTVAVMIVSMVVLISALGIYRLGLIPSGEELIRILTFVIICILFVGFWVALATALSVYLRQTATAALAGIAVWIFFTFFLRMIVDTIINMYLQVADIFDIQQYLQIEAARQMLARISPNTLFLESSSALLTPTLRTLRSLLLPTEVRGILPNPLPFEQSLLLVWPQIVALLALTSFCFAAAYVRFMRQEVRSL